MLLLTRPIVFIDLETTGIDVAKDRIVEIALLKVHPDQRTESIVHRVNPGIPIPYPASKIHGIFDRDVADKPHFSDIAGEIEPFLNGCDLAGFNSNNFDIPLLIEEFHRVNIEFELRERKLVDIQAIFHKFEPRNLTAAYKYYCGQDLTGAHHAEDDVRATYDVLLGQLAKYPSLKNDVPSLSQFSIKPNSVDLAGRIVMNEDHVEIFNFGKHKGKPVEEVFRNEASYYHWMINGEFPVHTKRVITSIWERMKKKKAAIQS